MMILLLSNIDSNHTGSGTYEITSTKIKKSDAVIDLDDELKKHYEHESKLYGFYK